MLNLIKNELEKKENISITENGAIGYKTTKSALLDLNYMVSSLRNAKEEEIISLFDEAFYENKEYALKWLFFARDVREGLGERRLFRICYKRLAELDVVLFCRNLDNIAEYGRWDDLVYLIGINEFLDEHIREIIKSQLDEDLNNIKEKKSISLLGKWLPSENASSNTTKKMAKKVRKLLGMSSKSYRLMLSKLRKYSNIVEVNMCGNTWKDIDYTKVPSLANLRYSNAFLEHDKERRIKYLNAVERGDARFNMRVATPIDVVSQYTFSGFLRNRVKDYDEVLELAWKNLKNIDIKDTLVVSDSSGSMTVKVNGSTMALDVANALAIYTSEHNSGVYKDKYITFSSNPCFIDLSNDDSLHNKLITANSYSEIANTNIEAVFKLILDVAVENDISEDEMIKSVLIISDMEFDSAQGYDNSLTKSLFEKISMSYNDAGYSLPRLIFWNVNSRTGTIPLIENDLGVILVSGFSQNVLRMVMSEKFNPYEVLVEMITSERYDRIKV